MTDPGLGRPAPTGLFGGGLDEAKPSEGSFGEEGQDHGTDVALACPTRATGSESRVTRESTESGNSRASGKRVLLEAAGESGGRETVIVLACAMVEPARAVIFVGACGYVYGLLSQCLSFCPIRCTVVNSVCCEPSQNVNDVFIGISFRSRQHVIFQRFIVRVPRRWFRSPSAHSQRSLPPRIPARTRPSGHRS